MKEIGVVSDTHIPKIASDLPSKVYEYLKHVDFIIHAGDFIDNFLFKKLRNIGDLIAVRGNMDCKNLKSKLPTSQVVNIEGYKIGITHGSGFPKETINNVKFEFTGKDLDMIIFGHTHNAIEKVEDDTIFLNPGSPTDKIFSDFLSFGVITLGEKIETEIIKI